MQVVKEPGRGWMLVSVGGGGAGKLSGRRGWVGSETASVWRVGEGVGLGGWDGA